jgi:hypothetical protein
MTTERLVDALSGLAPLLRVRPECSSYAVRSAMALQRPDR